MASNCTQSHVLKENPVKNVFHSRVGLVLKSNVTVTFLIENKRFCAKGVARVYMLTGALCDQCEFKQH